MALMTRINLIPPKFLADQHLIAEIKEINQLAGSFRKSLKSKNGIQNIPQKFTLNKGHVTFFYDKGFYLHKRFNLLKSEGLRRGFNINAKFNNEWATQPKLYNDWYPNKTDVSIILERINTRLLEKQDWYCFKGDVIKDMNGFINNISQKINEEKLS